MKEIMEARMGIIAVLALMLVSINRRLPATRRLSSGITTLALAGIVLLVAAGSASANGACIGANYVFGPGDTVNESCTFNASMVCTDNTKPGLYLGADNVVIDGAGYSMTGTRSAAACGFGVFGGAPSEAVPAKHSGIVNGISGTLPASYDNVVVKNLEITNFCTGIVLGDGSFAYDIDNNTVTECYIHDCGDSGKTTHGIHVVWANNCNMTKNEITAIQGTGIPGGCSGGGNGIFMYGSVDSERGWYNEITCNYLHGNEKSGFFMKHQCMHCTISYNNATENTEGGIMPNCKQSNFNAIEYNNMSGNAIWGMYCNGNANTIRYNTAHDNGNIGIELGGMAGVGNGGNNILVNNSLCGNVQDLVVAMIANNTGDSNTCGTGPAGWCDWNCADPVSTYFDFDQDGYYSQDGCSCTNQAGGKCACCNPGVFHSTHANILKGVGICRLSGDIHDDPNDCDNTIQGVQKPDYIVTAVDIVWLDDTQYNVNYTVKNDGDEAATVGSNTSITVDTSTTEVITPALAMGATSSGQVGPFSCSQLSDGVTVCADCNNDIDETLEGNNCDSTTTVTCKLPDYRIIDKYETWVDETAKTYNITYLICNNGTLNGTQNTITKVDTGSTGQPDTGVPQIPKGTCIWRVAQNDTGVERVYTMSGSYDEITLTANMGPMSGRMPELDTSNNAIMNTFYGAVVVSLDPCQATICSGSTCRTTVNITLSNIEDYGSGTIHLKYNPSVVEVVGVTSSADSVVGSWSHWSSGDVAISAYNSDGVSGTIVFAEVEFEPKGLPSQCSDLNITVTTLYDTSYEPLPYITSNCEICIYESVDPFITYPHADPVKILNDPGRARVPGTNLTTLRVHVTDDSNVVNVTVNMTPIWGPGNDTVEMSIESGGPKNATWYLPNVNAPHDPGVNQSVHCLYVNATDAHGNSETGECIPLTVLRRGNIVGDTTRTDMGDALYIARYTVGLEPAPDEFVAGIVPPTTWDGVNMGDALYIARWTVGLEVEP